MEAFNGERDSRYENMSPQEILIDRLETRRTEYEIRQLYAKKLYNKNRFFDYAKIPQHIKDHAMREMSRHEWEAMMQELTKNWNKFWCRRKVN